MILETNLPSVGSISILNSYRQVNCVTLSDSGAVMAVGQSNSTVKVFILSKKEHDILTVDDMIKQQVADSLKQGDKEEEAAKNPVPAPTTQ